MKTLSFGIARWSLFVALLLTSAAALASIDSGLSWLQSRQSTTEGVHRQSDLANRVDTNQEALFTLQRLSRTANFSATVQRAISDRTLNLYTLARLAHLRVDQGQSASTQLTELLASQNADGGFPAVMGQQSEAVATAYGIQALERAGQGAGTPMSRAVGYLQASQRTDGGWFSTFANLSTVYATSEAVMALQAVKARFDVSTASNRAKTFLLGKRNPDQSFGETFETSFAVNSLLALSVPRADLQLTVALLRTQQNSNGSFANDAYVTSVALRALWQFEQPQLPPSISGLRARVLSAATELVIEGATLTLTGTANTSLSSNNQGRIQSENLAPGLYQARVSFAGMREVGFELTVQAGRILELGDIRLMQGNTPQNNFAVIRGLVKSTTGAPIPSALVRIDGTPLTATSDSNGRFQFLQVNPGNVTVIGTATDFCTSQYQVTVTPREIIDITFILAAQATPTLGATVRGTILNAATNQPLSGVQIAVVAGAPAVNTSTTADGSYSLATGTGAVQIRASLAGFDSVDVSVPLIANQIFDFSPKLYAAGATPPGGNSSSITGTIVNQANRQPLANALIVVSDPSGQRSVRSQSDGRFSISGLRGPNTKLAISIDAFEPTTVLVPLQPLQNRDVGQIGLKPTTISFYLPDLRVTDSTLASSNPDSFALDSQFTVTVVNAGTSAVVQDFSLLAFIDGNNNGVFDSQSEPQVGRVRYDRDIPIGASAIIDIAVTAQLSFRDAPVSFWVDSEAEVIEDNNSNNTASSVLGCQVTPVFVGQNAVREKWRWRGLASNPNINSLMQVPSVTQLTDDNADGQINEFDIPDIVFVAGFKGRVTSPSTALVAVNGDTGTEIWAKPGLSLSNFSATATADIDNDGKTEIIAVSGSRTQLYAFEHDGTLKWRVNTGAPTVLKPLIWPAPLVWDQPVIANLDGDLEAEIILGKRVFRGLTGELLWTGEFDEGGSIGGKPANDPLTKVAGLSSIAADVDLNGTMEVIAGRTLYDFEGRTIWHRGDIKPEPLFDLAGTPIAHSGYTAVGNFDTDDFAEIVLAIDDELWLLEHTGQTIWGPKKSPDNRSMGAPVIADVDQDGLPEILIASNEKASVFESDGTLKWTQDAVDNSGSTSLTVFDFQNDGNLEAIHSDEDALRIFDAKTGNQLYFTTNRSLTVYEYPIVADIDGDKEAEIIVTSFDNEVGVQTPGVRVFEASGGSWADAGSVWGSHAFHIDDVKENSTIPLLETPSWLTHNTYRVQRSPQPDPLGMPDFTVGNLRLIEGGSGQQPRVTVRVGNAGAVDAHSPAILSLYRGDPAAGGVLLREMRLDALRPKLFQEIDFGQIPLTGAGELFVVVDKANRARECREQNNQRSIQFSVSNGLGALQLATDKLSYRPGENVNIGVTVNNQGAAPANFSVDLLIRDSQNRITATLPIENFVALAGGASRLQSQLWNSTGTLTGSYVVSAQLKNAVGDTIATETANFAIAVDTTGLAAGASIRSNKALYLSNERPQLLFRLQNLSASAILRVPEATITVTGPNNFNIERVFPFSDLFPAAVVQGDMLAPGTLANGSYAAVIRLRSRLNSSVILATDTTTFSVATPSTIGISGVVSVAQLSVNVGQTQSCLYTVRNQGMLAANNLALRRRVVEIDSGIERFTTTFNISLAAGADTVVNQQFNTAGFNAEDHACVLELSEGGSWRVLDGKPFGVTGASAPGILVAPTQGLVTSETGQTASFTVRLTAAPTANVTIAITNPDVTEFSLSAAQVVFTPTTWNDARTVVITGVNDDIADGDQNAVILLEPAVSTDVRYSGRNPDDVSATNIDDDIIGIRVSPSAVDVAETGSTATINISANAEPTSAVTIALRSSDSTEFSVSASSVSITPGNWQTPQAVTVTGVDDSLLDGLQVGLIVTDPAQSSDTRFNNINPPDVIARNADNELPSIIVEPVAVITSERGPAQTFVVRLNAAPNASVKIPLGPVDASEWQILDLELALDSSNWQQGRSVIVTPVNDSEVDGDQSGVLNLQAASSKDPRFNGIDPSDVALSNLDDDGAQILVDPINGLVVNESGSTAAFNVRLTFAPTSTVTIALQSGDSTEFSISPAQLSFAAGATASQTVTITGVDDADLDGNIVGQIITQVAISIDKRYNGINPPNVVVTNLDDESAQVFVTPQGSVNTSEDGTTANIGVRLSNAPSAEVRIPVRNNDATEWSLNRTELVFASGSSAEQIVTVTGVNDFLIDGDILGVIELGSLTSKDQRFNGINPPDVPAVNRDNDMAPAFIISPNTRLTTTEAGGSAFFEVRLSTEPSAAVTVPLSNPDTTEFALDRTQISFDPANWRSAQRVVVTGVDDIILDGDIEAQIGLLNAQSADVRYQGIDPPDVPVINLNDDFTLPAELSVNAIDLTTSESGETGRLEISLNRAPTGTLPVLIGISSSNTSEVIVEPLQLSFKANSGSSPQSIVLRGVDEFIDDGDQTVGLRVQVLPGSDPDFLKLPAQNFTATNADNDAVGVSLNITGPSEIQEGQATSLAIRLASKPTAAVALELDAVIRAPGAAGSVEFTLVPLSVSVIPEQWSQAQSLNLRTRDNRKINGDQVIEVRVRKIFSSDPLYPPLTVAPVAVLVKDRGQLIEQVPINRYNWLMALLLLLFGAFYATRSTVRS